MITIRELGPRVRVIGGKIRDRKWEEGFEGYEKRLGGIRRWHHALPPLLRLPPLLLQRLTMRATRQTTRIKVVHGSSLELESRTTALLQPTPHNGGLRHYHLRHYRQCQNRDRL